MIPVCLDILSPLVTRVGQSRKPTKPNALFRSLRLDYNFTKEELARKADVSSQTVRKAERGGTISEINQVKLAKVLKTTPEKLFGS